MTLRLTDEETEALRRRAEQLAVAKGDLDVPAIATWVSARMKNAVTD